MIRRIPNETDFPEGTEFIIHEFDTPLAWMPQDGRLVWINWFGGFPQPFNSKWLKVDNNWRADSFEEWAAVVAQSIPNDKDA